MYKREATYDARTIEDINNTAINRGLLGRLHNNKILKPLVHLGIDAIMLSILGGPIIQKVYAQNLPQYGIGGELKDVTAAGTRWRPRAGGIVFVRNKNDVCHEFGGLQDYSINIEYPKGGGFIYKNYFSLEDREEVGAFAYNSRSILFDFKEGAGLEGRVSNMFYGISIQIGSIIKEFIPHYNTSGEFDGGWFVTNNGVLAAGNAPSIINQSTADFGNLAEKPGQVFYNRSSNLIRGIVLVNRTGEFQALPGEIQEEHFTLETIFGPNFNYPYTPGEVTILDWVAAEYPNSVDGLSVHEAAILTNTNTVHLVNTVRPNITPDVEEAVGSLKRIAAALNHNRRKLIEIALLAENGIVYADWPWPYGDYEICEIGLTALNDEPVDFTIREIGVEERTEEDEGEQKPDPDTADPEQDPGWGL